MRKLSKINESVWSDIHKRSNGLQAKKEVGKLITIDGNGYVFPYDLLNYHKTTWNCFGFNKPEDDSNIINDVKFSLYDDKFDKNNSYEVYILKKYINTPTQKLIDDLIDATNIDDIKITHIQDIIRKHISRIFKDGHMEDYAKYFIFDVPYSSFDYDESVIWFDTDMEIFSDELEEEFGDISLIEEVNTFMYVMLDDWYVDLENELIEEYTKMGWIKSNIDAVDPYNSSGPAHSRGVLFVKLSDKYENIKESIWSDIHKRSNGTKIKREDNFDLMDIQQLYDYVKSNYWKRVEYINLVEGQSTQHIGVEIINCVDVNLNYSDDKIYNIIIDLQTGIGMDIELLLPEFNVKSLTSGSFQIDDKNGNTTNNTFIHLLDFLLDNPDIFDMNESVWSDIHKKSNGLSIRKEDKYDFNISKMEEVDLGPEFPILFADVDLVANRELYFNWEQVENMMDQIKNTGWRLPLGPYEMKLIIKLILKLDHISTEFKDSAYGMIKNEKTGEYVSFATPTKYGETYWCEDDYSGPYSPYASMNNQRVFEVGNNYYQGSRKMVLLATNNLEKTGNARIRLVKDK